MAYVSQPFEHDVFVSYSHGAARQKGRSRLASWSRRLAEELEVELIDVDPEFSEAFDLFIDRELDPAEFLTPQLQEKVRKSALLLVVMSPHYLQSKWCRDELTWFEDEVKVRQLTAGCVLVVRALPTDHNSWPSCLKDSQGNVVLGFPFHSEPVTDETRPYGWASSSEEDPEFFRALSSLAGTVQQRLRKLRENQKIRRQEIGMAGFQEGLARAVYLHATVADESEWVATKAELEDAGFQVLPDTLPRVERPTIEAASEAKASRLRDCKSARALLLLRPRDGSWIEDEIRTTGFSERADLKALAGVDLPCAVIDRIGSPIPLAAELGITVLPAATSDWLGFFKGWLSEQQGNKMGARK